MALTLVVRSGDETDPPRITFDAPRVVIGRGEGCEVRLPDPSVSQRHASIRQRGTEYIVMDEGSTNGTYVGPMRLSPHAPRVLRSGELVRVGRVWLEAVIEHVPATANTALATRELALSLVAAGLAAEGVRPGVEVRAVEGPAQGASATLAEFDRPYVVGRMKSADLDLDDPDLSRRHVELTRRGEKLFASDLGSKNGTRLGGRPLGTDPVEWPRRELLRLGATALAYEDPVSDALAALERAADERIRDGDAIEPPHGATPPPEEPVIRATAAERVRAVPSRPARGRAPGNPGWTATDLLVALLALVVLGLSLAGLVWLARGG